MYDENALLSIKKLLEKAETIDKAASKANHSAAYRQERERSGFIVRAWLRFLRPAASLNHSDYDVLKNSLVHILCQSNCEAKLDVFLEKQEADPVQRKKVIALFATLYQQQTTDFHARHDLRRALAQITSYQHSNNSMYLLGIPIDVAASFNGESRLFRLFDQLLARAFFLAQEKYQFPDLKIEDYPEFLGLNKKMNLSQLEKKASGLKKNDAVQNKLAFHFHKVLVSACQEGRVEVVKVVLAVYSQRKLQEGLAELLHGALYLACENGHIEVVKLLLASYSPELLFEALAAEYHHALFGACHKGWISIVKLLFAVYPDALLQEGLAIQDCRVFCWSCASGHAEVVKRLLALYADKGLLALAAGAHMGFRWACERGYIDVVKLLLAAYPQELLVEALNANFNFALRLSCKNAHVDIVTLLLPLYCCDAPISYRINKKDIKEQLVVYLKTRLTSAEEKKIFDTPALHTALNWIINNHPEVKAARTFAQVVLQCDQYLRFFQPEQNNKIEQFFSIAKKLPLEIQMILCNRIYGLARISISVKGTTDAFKDEFGEFAKTDTLNTRAD